MSSFLLNKRINRNDRSREKEDNLYDTNITRDRFPQNNANKITQYRFSPQLIDNVTYPRTKFAYWERILSFNGEVVKSLTLKQEILGGSVKF